MFKRFIAVNEATALNYTCNEFADIYCGYKKLKQTPRPDGYMAVHINKKTHYVHRLVVRAFYGDPPTPAHTVIDHLNNDHSDNRPSNLVYATRRQNRRGSKRARSGGDPSLNIYKRKNGRWSVQHTFHGRQYTKTFESIHDATDFRDEINAALAEEKDDQKHEDILIQFYGKRMGPRKRRKVTYHPPPPTDCDWQPLCAYKHYALYPEPKYWISSTGRVWNSQLGRTLSPQTHPNGYNLVNLVFPATTTTARVHRLVALTHIPNPDNKPVVDHIDGDKLNNDITNLRWATYSENSTNNIKYREKKKKKKKSPLFPLLRVKTP